MMRLPTLICLLLAVTRTAMAGACPIDTLATYTAGGFSCSIGGLMFSNFTYTGTASGGAGIASASAIAVSPVSSGLQFRVPFGVLSGQTQDGLIGFRVTVSSGNLIGFASSMLGYGTTGTGTVSVATTGSNGVEPFLFYNAGGTVATQSVTFGGVTSLPVITDIAVNGNGGSALVSGASQQFTTSP